METTRCAVIFLVSACLWRASCTSSIELCTDSPTSFVNGTAIPAMLGQPVSVVFCVQCQPGLHIGKLIRINHPNHPTEPTYYFYENNKDVRRPIIVNITASANKATINITIKAVRKNDFTAQFSVTIFTDKGGNDYSVFFFHLGKTATSGSARTPASTPVGQKAQEHESESSALLIALPPVCFIILVFIIIGVVWYRVKGIRISRTRSEKVIDYGSGNDDSGKAMYANLKEAAVGRAPVEQGADHQQEAGQQQEADGLQCQEDSNTTDLKDQVSGRFITEDGLVYITAVNVNNQINRRAEEGKHPSKHKCDDEGLVEYITLDFEKKGKLLVADEEENKEDDC